MYQIPLSLYNIIFYNEWKLDQNRSDYNIVFNQELNGQIDIPRLYIAVRRYISQHILLNSHIIEDKNGELYWIKNNKIYDLEYFKNEPANQDILSYIQRPFNLEGGPLYRFRLIKNCNNKYTLMIVLHHIVIDGQAVDYFIDTLSNYYNDKCYKNNISIEEQLLSITKLSKKLLQYVALNKEKSKVFWREKLLDIEPLDLSFLKLAYSQNKLLSREAQETRISVAELSGIGEITFSFSKQVSLKLNQLNKKYIMTSYLYGRNIYAMLLNRYTGQDKFCISYPVAIKEGIDFIYGAHVNTNVIPYNFGKINNIIDLNNQSKEFIKSLRSEVINHSYLPIFDIAVSNKNILNISFAQTNLKNKNWEFINIKASINNDTDIDLSAELSFEQAIKHEEIHYKVKYRIDKIDRFLLTKFIACYKRLFIEVLDELTNLESISHLTHIKNYNLLSHEQYQQIIHTWNQTDKNYPDTKIINQLFEEQVERTPDNIAVVYEETKLTYKELNTQANQLANYLRQNHNITPDTLIALCLERSEHMLIAILATLKAGAAYVPMDPSYPDERISYILQDTNTKLVLTNEVHNQRLEDISQVVDATNSGNTAKSTASANAIDLKYRTSGVIDHKTNILSVDSEEVQEQLSLQLTSHPKTAVTSTNLAYVIYTSGSTGKPKGVMIGHENLSHYLSYSKNTYHDYQGLTLLHSSIAFDMSITSLFLPLTNGGKIEILPEKTATESLELILKKASDFNFIKFTPSHLRALKNHLPFHQMHNKKDA